MNYISIKLVQKINCKWRNENNIQKVCGKGPEVKGKREKKNNNNTGNEKPEWKRKKHQEA